MWILLKVENITVSVTNCLIFHFYLAWSLQTEHVINTTFVKTQQLKQFLILKVHVKHIFLTPSHLYATDQ